jgi:CDP-archaeol synthase
MVVLENLMHELPAIVYLFSPLLMGLAFHGCCMKFNWLSHLSHPIDHGATFRGKRLFGDNKTYRGVVAVSLGTALGFGLQSIFLHQIDFIKRIELFAYSPSKTMIIGSAMGLAGMLSELPNSFIKRQCGIAPGRAGSGWEKIIFYGYDQIDFLVGAWIVLSMVVSLTAGRILISVLFMLVAHQALTSIGYVLGMRATPR